jgi:hypothetical protein
MNPYIMLRRTLHIMFTFRAGNRLYNLLREFVLEKSCLLKFFVHLNPESPFELRCKKIKFKEMLQSRINFDVVPEPNPSVARVEENRKKIRSIHRTSILRLFFGSLCQR